MHNKLNILRALIQSHGRYIEYYDALDRSTITTTMKSNRIVWNEEIRMLYTWANGTNESISDPLFRDCCFISLKRVLEQKDIISAYQGFLSVIGIDIARMIPFASRWGNTYALYYGSIQKLNNPIVSFADTFSIEYKNMDSMLDTCIGWWSQNPPDTERDLSGKIWYHYNAVDGDPFYIENLTTDFIYGN